MNFCKTQPQELEQMDLVHTCPVCKEELNLQNRDCTPFRGQWVHLECWKKLF